MSITKRTGANHVAMIFKELQKKSKPLSPAEQEAEKAAWKAQELKLDHMDRVVK